MFLVNRCLVEILDNFGRFLLVDHVYGCFLCVCGQMVVNETFRVSGSSTSYQHETNVDTLLDSCVFYPSIISNMLKNE